MTLPVYYERRTVGTIDIGANGPGFTYDPEWIGTRGAFPISTSIALQTERLPPAHLLPWAANLLPESSNLQAVGQFLGVAQSDVVGLLAEIGRDTAGALSFGRVGSASMANWKRIEKTADLERIINELPRKPFLVGEEGVSMSLAGAQAKLAVGVDDFGNIFVPHDGSPSTHILKPDIPNLWGSVQNEAFCLVLARLVKLPVAEVTTGTAGERSYLLVNRYDRSREGQLWRRIHQEDFCQALGKPPTAKYESNQTGIRGPRLVDMFDVTRRHANTTDILRLLDMVIFNVLTCNTDAHAKNYSLIIKASGASLAPMYDVMCAEVWENVTKNMAQKIAGKSRGDHLYGKHWRRFATDCGLNPRQVVARVQALADEVDDKIDAALAEVAAMPAGTHPQLPHVAETVRRRTRAIKNQIKRTNAEAEGGDETRDDTEARTDAFVEREH